MEPVCHSFHCVRLLALPDKSKRATLKAPRKCIYNHPTRYNPSIEMDTASWKECIQYTQGAFPLLCSWLIVELCENSTQSKPKRTVTPLCIYVHPTFAQLELPVRIWHRKSNNYYRNNKTFSEKVSKKVMRGGTVVKRRGAAEHDSSNKRNDI